jgi:hypothetical protein
MKPIKITLPGLIFEMNFKASGLFKVYTVNKVPIIPTNINVNIIPVKNEDIGFLGLTVSVAFVLKGFFKEGIFKEEGIFFFNDDSIFYIR